jgi:hypothetical protein
MANAAVLEAIADPDFQTELCNDHGDVAKFISLLDPEVELQTPGGPRLREPQPRASGSVTMTPGQNGACVRFRRAASPTQVRRKS